MKKLISILLSLVILFAFSACGKKSKKAKSNSVDFEYYAKLGQISEIPYALGKNVDEIIDELTSKAEENDSDEYVFNIIEGEKNVLIDNGTVLYYYSKADKEKGISYIVDFGTAFGFEIGTVSVEIKEALSDYKCTEETATTDNAVFLYEITDGTIYKYTFDNYVVMFVFQENMLFATAIYDSNYWS